MVPVKWESTQLAKQIPAECSVSAVFQVSISKATVGTNLGHINAASTVILGDNVVCGALLGCGFVAWRGKGGFTSG